jgi:hypothetical protein
MWTQNTNQTQVLRRHSGCSTRGCSCEAVITVVYRTGREYSACGDHAIEHVKQHESARFATLR